MSQEDEDLIISPVKIVEIDHSGRGKFNAPTTPAPNNMQNSRAYGSGSVSNHRASDGSSMVCSIAFLYFEAH